MSAADPRNGMWAEACAMIERAERLHRHFFEPEVASINWEPPVDVVETGRELWIIAALPGVASEDLDISIVVNELSIAGVRRLPSSARAGTIHRLEIPYGRFARRIRLPAARLQLERSELASGCLFIVLRKQT